MANYKLIKKLPFEASPEIGYISKPSNEKDGAHYWNHNWFYPQDYPEYWDTVVETKLKYGLTMPDFIGFETYYPSQYSSSMKWFDSKEDRSKYIEDSKPKYSKKDMLSFGKYAGGKLIFTNPEDGLNDWIKLNKK